VQRVADVSSGQIWTLRTLRCAKLIRELQSQNEGATTTVAHRRTLIFLKCFTLDIHGSVHQDTIYDNDQNNVTL